MKTCRPSRAGTNASALRRCPRCKAPAAPPPPRLPRRRPWSSSPGTRGREASPTERWQARSATQEAPSFGFPCGRVVIMTARAQACCCRHRQSELRPCVDGFAARDAAAPTSSVPECTAGDSDARRRLGAPLHHTGANSWLQRQRGSARAHMLARRTRCFEKPIGAVLCVAQNLMAAISLRQANRSCAQVRSLPRQPPCKTSAHAPRPAARTKRRQRG